MKQSAVLVIRSDDKFSDLLRAAGFEVLNIELITTEPVKALGEIRFKLNRLHEYDGLFFSSPAAAEVFVRHRDGSNGFHGKIYALGERAKTILEDAGLEVSFAALANTAGEMLASFETSEFAGKRFLFVRGDKSMRTIPEFLNGRAIVDEIVVYTTEASKIDEAQITELKRRMLVGEIDWTCFFNPTGVETFAEVFGGTDFRSVRAAAIGVTTAAKALEMGLDVNFISKRSTAEEFARGLIEHINNGE